jgi:hypothetical protein
MPFVFINIYDLKSIYLTEITIYLQSKHIIVPHIVLLHNRTQNVIFLAQLFEE